MENIEHWVLDREGTKKFYILFRMVDTGSMVLNERKVVYFVSQSFKKGLQETTNINQAHWGSFNTIGCDRIKRAQLECLRKFHVQYEIKTLEVH